MFTMFTRSTTVMLISNPHQLSGNPHQLSGTTHQLSGTTNRGKKRQYKVT